MIQTIKKILPQKVKNSISGVLKKLTRSKSYEESLEKISAMQFKERQQIEKRIPVIELSQKHIQHLKTILNRQELLRLMPQNAVCAEIGVDKGDFSAEILKITKPKKLHLIDAWGDAGRYHDGLKLIIEEKFENEIGEDLVEINLGYSTNVLKKMHDNYFDWVYLDTDHSYKTTAQELSILNKKMKPGGIICGHDYVMGNWVGGVRYGVIEAVHEFCCNEHWELIYLTINKSEMPSFAIRKLS